LILSLSIGTAVLVKTIRNPIESFQGSSVKLKEYEGGAFISPTIYLYTCSHLGVLNKYFENRAEKGV